MTSCGVRIRDAMEMISGGVDAGGPRIWADLGCGDGTFTRALAQLLAAGSVVHAIDLDDAALRNIPAELHGVRIATHRADFTRTPWPFDERVDGILMANSLHYVREQEAFIRQCDEHLKDDGRFVVVEYDFDRPNRWVPYPVSRHRLDRIVRGRGRRLFITSVAGITAIGVSAR